MTPFYKELKNFKRFILTYIYIFTEQEGEQGYQPHIIYTKGNEQS